MKKMLLTTAILAFLPLSAVAQQPFPNMGLNLPYLDYFNNMGLYADVMNAVDGGYSPWDKLDQSGPAALDSTGAPTEPAYTTFTAAYPNPLTLTWDSTNYNPNTGTGTITIDGGCTGDTIVQDGIHLSQQVTCPIVNTAASQGGNVTQFYFLYAAPPVTNIHMTIPQNKICDMWNCDLINDIASFTNIRYMDLLSSNFASDGVSINPVQDWSDRTWPSEGSRAYTQQGMAYEDVINLTNYTGKDAWINIPYQASDDYVCRLGRLLVYGEQGDKSNAHCDPLAPGNGTVTPISNNVTIRFERGNEPWNNQFPWTTQLYCIANRAPPDPVYQPCPNGTNYESPSAFATRQLRTAPWNNPAFWDTNNGSLGPTLKGYALQLLLTWNDRTILQQIFQAAGYNPPLQMINTQSFAGILNVKVIQQFLQPTYGMQQFADIMAFSPAIGPQCTESDSPPPCPTGGDSTVDMIFQDLQYTYNCGFWGCTDPSAGSVAEMQDDVNQAASVNMIPVCYECEVAWQSYDYPAVGVAASNDPRMAQWIITFFNTLQSVWPAGSLANYFSYAGGWGINSFANWGAKQHQYDLCPDGTEQIWYALMALTSNPANCPSP